MQNKIYLARIVFSPPSAILAGMIFCNFPYIYLYFDNKLLIHYGVAKYGMDILIVSIVYTLFFCLGVSISRILSVNKKEILWIINEKRLKFSLLLSMLILIILIFQIIQMFGFIPLLVFNSTFDSAAMNEIIVEKSQGKFGMLNAISKVCFFLLLLYMATSSCRNRFINFFWCFIVISLLIFAEIFLGKRQGFIIYVFVMIYFFSHSAKIDFKKYIRKVFKGRYLFIFNGLIIAFGIMSAIRNDQSWEFFLKGYDEIARYLSYPFMNSTIIYSLDKNIWLPNDFIGFFTQLLPYSYQANLSTADTIPSYEPGIGLNLPTLATWSLGYLMASFFYFLLGLVSNIFYRKARNSLYARMIYGFIFWALIGSHTYNHILSIHYFILPLFVAICISAFLTTRTSRSNAN